mmetsp:Transcript_76554/g.216470  ORF Transcript_76554/g.216470 Transcript_76554/m.216470 type:complete len:257 (+) Transcript_76554:258-1028(+)
MASRKAMAARLSRPMSIKGLSMSMSSSDPMASIATFLARAFALLKLIPTGAAGAAADSAAGAATRACGMPTSNLPRSALAFASPSASPAAWKISSAEFTFSFAASACPFTNCPSPVSSMAKAAPEVLPMERHSFSASSAALTPASALLATMWTCATAMCALAARYASSSLRASATASRAGRSARSSPRAKTAPPESAEEACLISAASAVCDARISISTSARGSAAARTSSSASFAALAASSCLFSATRRIAICCSE